jgi:hypothetical protein
MEMETEFIGAKKKPLRGFLYENGTVILRGYNW